MAYKYFFQLHGLAGDSKGDQAHQGWFDVYAFSLGGHASPVGAGAYRPGKVKSDELFLTLRSSAATGGLWRALMDGTNFSKGILEGADDGRVLTHMEFDNLIVMSMRTAGTDENQHPLEVAAFDVAGKNPKP